MANLRSTTILTGLLCAAGPLTAAMATESAPASAPNLSSADSPWTPTTGDGFLPPPSGFGPVAYDKANPHIVPTLNLFGQVSQRPLRLADLNNPNLKSWVVGQLKESNDDLLAGKLRYASRASCLPAGVPMFLIYGAGFQRIYFVQTASKIVIINSQNSEIRHVYLNVPHSEHVAASWYGESIGFYEGDELVVDTVGFNDKTMLDDNYDVPHTTQLHVIERFKPAEDGKTLQVAFTVNDPGAFNAPWSGTVQYRRAPGAQRLGEDACAENNINVLGDRNHTPTATTPDF